MMKELHRILFGEAPASFLLEVLIRTVVIVILLQFIVRPLGKRMSGQLTITELAIVIMLGAIIGAMAEIPDKGLMQGALALLLIAIFQRSITWLGVHNEKIENLTQGKFSIVVKEGVIQLPALKKALITKEQLFTILRSQEIYQLGQVKRVYLEASGAFSIYKMKTPSPGLSTLPTTDNELHVTRAEEPLKACTSCGNLRASDHGACDVCKQDEWAPAQINI
ncbi:YetF domain-containing protein [Chitinophaga sp.]|uniref:DUF421 domain-containing protein n=1 Tax=Chitinophaga sp. TaxID=1869181 RepID=UPI0031DA571B